MSVRAVCLILATLVVCSQGADVKYSELVAGGHVIDMGIELSFKDEDNQEATKYNKGSPCELEDSKCQDPKFGSDKDSELILSLTIPKKLDTLKKVGDLTLTPPKSLTVKLCYAKKWTVDRKWRKIKDQISKDKRCKNKVIKKLELPANGSVTQTYKIPTDISKAQWFFTAYLECDVEGKDDTAFCGLDTTGGLAALAKEADVQDAAGEKADAKKLLKAPTSPQIFIFTDIRESRPAGLFVAVIIMSVLSVSMLFGFFVWEHLTKKTK